MNEFWTRPLTYKGVPIIFDDAELRSALEVAFEACKVAPQGSVLQPAEYSWSEQKPDIMLVSRELIAMDLKSRSRSHQRKVDRERRTRCAVGIHAWSLLFDVCMGCRITRIEYVERGPLCSTVS